MSRPIPAMMAMAATTWTGDHPMKWPGDYHAFGRPRNLHRERRLSAKAAKHAARKARK
jgi:hypothetical protein